MNIDTLLIAGRTVRRLVIALLLPALILPPAVVHAEGEWEITAESDAARDRGLKWLAANQGPDGNWNSKDLGLVSLGALAFLSAGHTPGHGPYGATVDQALDYVLRNARPGGLLNISVPKNDMYNHGLSAFVLGQAYGMTNDRRIGTVLDQALTLIARTQCDDGGWDYRAHRMPRGHDLSLAVMQAKALRGAIDSGLQVSPTVVDLALRSVRAHYRTGSGRKDFDNPAVRAEPGQFTYDGHATTLAMAACGVVCLQEFGEYDDWRIPRNVELITKHIQPLQPAKTGGRMPLGAYSLYYVGQALYQVGGEPWRDCYPPLRDALVAAQHVDTANPQQDGWWEDGVHLSAEPGRLYGTAVACFILSIPNRYLPILQEGRIDSLKSDTKAP